MSSGLKRIEKGIKAGFFQLVRAFLKRGRTLPPIDPMKLKKILLLRPESKLGDLVISLPVAANIRRLYPHIEVSILCSPRNAILIHDDARFATVHLYRKHVWKDIREIVRIRRKRYDCVIDLLINDSVTSLMLSQLTSHNAPRIGAGKPEFGRYYDFHLDVPLENEDQIIISTLKNLRPLGLTLDQLDGHAPVFTGEKADRKAKEFIHPLRGDGALLIGYNLSAGSANRVWPLERSQNLLRKLLATYPNARIILFTPPKEREKGEEVMAGFDKRVMLVPPGLSILEAAAVIRELNLLITPDTSLVHIARGFHVPVVALMPSLTLCRWRPYGQEIGMVVCKTGDHIHDITVEEVFAMVEKMFASSVSAAGRR